MSLGRRGSCFVLAALLPLVLPNIALALQVPNAGQAMRDIESVQPAQPAPSELELDLPKAETPAAPAAPDTSGIRVQVETFAIEGNQVFSTERLQALLADLQGQELDLAGLRGPRSVLPTTTRSRVMYWPALSCHPRTLKTAWCKSRWSRGVTGASKCRTVRVPWIKWCGRRCRR